MRRLVSLCFIPNSRLPMRVEGVGEKQRIRRADLVGRDVALTQKVDERVPVVEIEHLVEGDAEALEVLGTGLRARLLGLEVLAPQDLVGIAKPAALETDRHRRPDDAGRGDSDSWL